MRRPRAQLRAPVAVVVGPGVVTGVMAVLCSLLVLDKDVGHAQTMLTWYPRQRVDHRSIVCAQRPQIWTVQSGFCLHFFPCSSARNAIPDSSSATASGPPARRVSRGRQRFEAGQAGRGSRAPPSPAVLVHAAGETPAVPR